MSIFRECEVKYNERGEHGSCQGVSNGDRGNLQSLRSAEESLTEVGHSPVYSSYIAMPRRIKSKIEHHYEGIENSNTGKFSS